MSTAGTVAAGEVHGYLTGVTDYVFRGVSQSDEQPSIQAGIDYAHSSGFFAGLFVAGIDYPETPFRADSGNVEFDAYLGYRRPAGRNLAWEVGLYRYAFPDSEAEDKDYNELGLNLYVRDTARLGATYSDDARTGGASAWTAEIELRHPLGRRFQVSGLLGRYAFARSDWEDYLYWDVGVSATRGSWTFDLRYFGTSEEAETLAGPRLTRDRVVGSVSIGF
jgi:uncharacterized protein (TIGR02001 family)